MEYKFVDLPELAIIGKEGLCTEEKNIVQDLWREANSHFDEVAALGMKEAGGSYVGFWGAMSDESRAFQPWSNQFSRGLYLAGVEAYTDSVAPEGWTKWILPARKYLVVEVDPSQYADTFYTVINHLIPQKRLKLSGAVCDYTEPATGKNKLFFPVVFLQDCSEGEMHLIKADADQIEKIVGLSVSAFETDVSVGGAEGDYPPEFDSVEWHSQMAREGHLYQAMIGEKIVGAAIVFPDQTENCVYIGRIFIDSVYHRKGYGIRLMECIEKQHPSAEAFYLDTPSWNERTNAFYKKIGYRVTKEVNGFVFYQKKRAHFSNRGIIR